jgi:hypothetical protein
LEVRKCYYKYPVIILVDISILLTLDSFIILTAVCKLTVCK